MIQPLLLSTWIGQRYETIRLYSVVAQGDVYIAKPIGSEYGKFHFITRLTIAEVLLQAGLCRTIAVNRDNLIAGGQSLIVSRCSSSDCSHHQAAAVLVEIGAYVGLSVVRFFGLQLETDTFE